MITSATVIKNKNNEIIFAVDTQNFFYNKTELLNSLEEKYGEGAFLQEITQSEWQAHCNKTRMTSEEYGELLKRAQYEEALLSIASAF